MVQRESATKKGKARARKAAAAEARKATRTNQQPTPTSIVFALQQRLNRCKNPDQKMKMVDRFQEILNNWQPHEKNDTFFDNSREGKGKAHYPKDKSAFWKSMTGPMCLAYYVESDRSLNPFCIVDGPCALLHTTTYKGDLIVRNILDFMIESFIIKRLVRGVRHLVLCMDLYPPNEIANKWIGDPWKAGTRAKRYNDRGTTCTTTELTFDSVLPSIKCVTDPEIKPRIIQLFCIACIQHLTGRLADGGDSMKECCVKITGHGIPSEEIDYLIGVDDTRDPQHLTDSVLVFSHGRVDFSTREFAHWPEADQQIIACAYAILRNQTDFSTSIEIYCDDSDIKVMSLFMLTMHLCHLNGRPGHEVFIRHANNGDVTSIRKLLQLILEIPWRSREGSELPLMPRILFILTLFTYTGTDVNPCFKGLGVSKAWWVEHILSRPECRDLFTMTDIGNLAVMKDNVVEVNNHALLLVYMLALSYKYRTKLRHIGFEATLQIKDRASLYKLFEKQTLCLRHHCLSSIDPNQPGTKLPLTMCQLQTQFARTQDVMDVFTSAIEMAPPSRCEELSPIGWICKTDGAGVRRSSPRPDTDEGAQAVKLSQDLTKTIKCKSCKKGCVTKRCICKSKGVQCSDLCGCVGCKNDKDTPIKTIDDGLSGTVTIEENETDEDANDDDCDDEGMSELDEDPDSLLLVLAEGSEEEENDTVAGGAPDEEASAKSDDELIDGMSIEAIRDILGVGNE